MERSPRDHRRVRSVEREFAHTRLGSAQLARAYERLVPVYRRDLADHRNSFDRWGEGRSESYLSRSSKGA